MLLWLPQHFQQRCRSTASLIQVWKTDYPHAKLYSLDLAQLVYWCYSLHLRKISWGYLCIIDNITICDYAVDFWQAQHDRNLESFLEAAKKRNLTFNRDKCTFSTTTISILGSLMSNGEIKSGPLRLSQLPGLLVQEISKHKSEQ